MAQELINGIFIGKFHEFVTPKFHFSYLYFDWIKPWPYWGMALHYAVTIFAAFAVAFNFHYRLFTVILFLGYTLLFFFEHAHYINHFYLYCLINFWLMVLPLNKRRTTHPSWTLYLILFHMSLAYFFGGIAKLNSDWLAGTPMDLYLAARSRYPLGFLYSQKWAPLAFSYGGLLFDLLIVPLMLIKRTRLVGLGLSLIFHLSNVLMFGLATFPWFSLLLTSMFFSPSWPRKIPLFKNFLPWGIEEATSFMVNKPLVIALSVYCLIHLALPLRHLLYPGITSWTEEGHMFAWRMMLRTKRGSTSFFVQTKDGRKEMVSLKEHLTKSQIRDMSGHPDRILQFAHYLKNLYQKNGSDEISVYASSRVGLNGRPLVEMIYPGTDLAKEKRSLFPYRWVKPLPLQGLKQLAQKVKSLE